VLARPIFDVYRNGQENKQVNGELEGKHLLSSAPLRTITFDWRFVVADATEIVDTINAVVQPQPRSKLYCLLIHNYTRLGGIFFLLPKEIGLNIILIHGNGVRWLVIINEHAIVYTVVKMMTAASTLIDKKICQKLHGLSSDKGVY
jgi:hypothetical protein